MSRYNSKSTNPFEEDDEIDDETFLKNSRHPQGSFDDELKKLQENRRDIENRTITSTERSIGILRDSEQIGIATAEELARQREQLERTDKRLDEINATLRFSQKHINGIKSVFSSLKNFMSGKSESSPNLQRGESKDVDSPLKETLGNYDRYENHPSTRLHQTEGGGQTQASGSKNISAKLDANLQEMSTSLSRLKGLATNLSFEIDNQNELIDTIATKTDKADVTIQMQNKDMNRILKK
ncbi:synaptosomal-associated protein 29-like [Onthophagus taurus]|uniref:synaptosomal-associated protein 29-like n=1 Tax=Onthophagus taurus TaxID=166361 RepID=UPI000C20E464|nr:synaptosomal-associated protein 29-like [Onthophagus taurus]